MEVPTQVPGPAKTQDHDPEKGLTIDEDAVSPDSSITSPNNEPHTPEVHISLPPSIVRINDKIESLAGIEARGIKRVLPSERHGESLMGDFQMAFLWFSANITANNLAVGFLGPLLFELGFVDSAMCAVFGGLVGCIMTAYMSIWGAASGNRTMVCLTTLSKIFVLYM